MLKKISFLVAIMGVFLGLQLVQSVASIKVEKYTIPFYVHWSVKFSNIKYAPFAITFVGRDGETREMTFTGREGGEVSVGDPGMDDVTQIIIHSCKFTLEQHSYWPFPIWEGNATGELEGISLFEPFNNNQEIMVKLKNDQGVEVGNGYFKIVLDEATGKLTSIHANSWGRDLGNLTYRK